MKKIIMKVKCYEFVYSILSDFFLMYVITKSRQKVFDARIHRFERNENEINFEKTSQQ